VVDGVITIPLFAVVCVDDSLATGAGGREQWDCAGDGERRLPSGSTVASKAPKVGFLAGAENRLLVEAVNSLLHEATSPYNPLLLCGPPGCGKSHIAGGIAGRWRDEDRHVVYVNGADFARSFAAAVETRSTAAWRSRHRDVSLFVLEDLTQLAGKQAALDELLQTIDALLRDASQIVLTSRLAPKHIPGMSEALAARLTGGLFLQVAPPGAAARLALVQQFAAHGGISLPESAARTLAEGLAATAPELSSALTEIHLESQLDSEPISVERVRRFIGGGARAGAVRPTVRSIAALSAKYFGLKVSELVSPTRRRAVVQARNVAIYLARHLAGNSLEQLGRYFGGRDHTTILHGYRTIETRARTDPSVRQALHELRQMLAHG
jgi:chromosomal replication initiator protein